MLSDPYKVDNEPYAELREAAAQAAAYVERASTLLHPVYLTDNELRALDDIVQVGAVTLRARRQSVPMELGSAQRKVQRALLTNSRSR